METAHLFIALYLDADVSRNLASEIRVKGFDVISAKEVGNAELKDRAQLDYAIAEHRALLTHNIQDFVPLLNEYWRDGKEHFGVIGSKQMSLGELLRRVLNLLNTVDSEEMKNSYRDLAEFK